MIEGRIILPTDVFTQLCMEVKTLSDLMLRACFQLQKEVNMLPDDCVSLNEMTKATSQLRLIENVLRIIVEEHMPARQTPPDESGGGESCNAQ